MGIKGLLNELKSSTRHCNISNFRGKRIAVDGYVWLHKCAHLCAKEIFHDPGSKEILPFLLTKLQLLLNNEIQPFFVFDGRPLPSKLETNRIRHEAREKASKYIYEMEKNGKTNELTSYDYIAAISIQFETVKTFIVFLKTQNIPFIIAPYEADAQLAYLSRTKQVDLVLTDDSDLLPYGASDVLFKMNDEGNVDYIKFVDVISVFKINDYKVEAPKKKSKKVISNSNDKLSMSDFYEFTGIEGVSENQYDDFLTVCILCGCDYSPPIKTIGFSMARKLVAQYHSNINLIVNEIQKKCKLLPNYNDMFSQAKLTFKYHKIYSIELKRIIPLTPMKLDDLANQNSFSDDYYDFAGKVFDGETLQLHIIGAIDSHHNDID